MKNFNSVRGTNDYLPMDAKIRETVKNKILSNYQNNGFLFIVKIWNYEKIWFVLEFIFH